MKRETKYRMYKKIALVVTFSMLFQSFYPTVVYALTGGPSSPEFSSFEPVATTNMVNEFTGDFTYNLPVLNIPGANGGGYALSLSYHSGEGMESEASWVGYGWSLNPGAINRIKRGFPDDSNGDDITYHNNVPRNWTASVGAHAGNIEAFSKDVPLNIHGSIRYNNYRGFGYTYGGGLSVQRGLVSLGYSISDGEGSFSVHVNPAALLNKKDKDGKKQDNSANYKASQKTEKKNTKELKKALSTIGQVGSSYGMYCLADIIRPTVVTPYTGVSISGNLSIELCPSLPVGPEVGLSGSYTHQTNVAEREVATYGYMYSGEGKNDEDGMMDYYVEKESPYCKRDMYLPIPFSNADIFSLSGEGLGGGFRLHSAMAGHFRPNYVESKTNIYQGGFETQVGGNIGSGADVGVGWQKLKVTDDWDGKGNTDIFQFPVLAGESYFFRFNNDLGGSVSFRTTDAANRANITVNGLSLAPGDRQFRPFIQDITSAVLKDNMDNVNRSGRSSYIAYHTNKEMTQKASNNDIKYYAYEKNSSTNQWIDRSQSSIQDGLGELVVFNEDGNRYVYGLPVYSRNEASLQYGLSPLPANKIENNQLAYKNISNPSMKVGEERSTPYATTYLLTEITTPDYVDRKMDGIDDDDFGGYTKFIYKRVYGSDNKTATDTSWYQWRIPYTGLLYEPADMLDNTDDMGGVTYGEKEIYYLDTIKTKTHIAVFKTSPRYDGYGAASNYLASKSSTAKGGADQQKLQKLDAIELYAKPTDGSNNYKLIQKVNFEYEYELCKEIPNSVNNLAGKLTLKKVWFEYDGVVNAKISPYLFEYNYPSSTETDYPAKYNDFEDYGMQADSLENPDYSEFNLDRWGNYQYNGDSCHNNMIPWVDQAPDTTKFDPAAWQLKVIKLPSGGEIHIQYEQDDYLYVQDRRAMAMVSLKATTDISGRGNKYYLDVENDLGITGASAKKSLADLIRKEYKDKKIYFKFLYALTPAQLAELRNGNSDYVSGYVRFDNAGVTGNDDTDTLWVEFKGNASSYELPCKVCEDYVKSKAGKMIPENNMDASSVGVDNKDDVIDILEKLVSKIGKNFMPMTRCLTINPEHSYIRIPVLHGKKGGGLRVKRLLMYDYGMESADVSLYGSEYVYQQEDGESSGVATNEPAEGREENALVDLLIKRENQKWWQKAISGKDKEQFEGPLGESILPSPSIGYSRVVVKNIHSGKTNTGFVVNEFFTVKDYPFDKQYNNASIKGKGFTDTGKEQKQDWMMVPALLVNYSISNLWMSQGYRFVITNMHGQPRSIKTYMGDYADINNPKDCPVSSSQEFTYYEPGESIPMMYDIDDIHSAYPGKEMEVVFEKKSVEDRCHDLSIEWDVSVAALPIPIPFGSVCPSLSYTESLLRTHVTTKVINYPAIQKSILVYQDGIFHLTENLAFNPHTGKPILTRTTDGYDALDLAESLNHKGTYHNYTIPASSKYEEMSQKAVNERKLLTSSMIDMDLTADGSGYYLEFSNPSQGKSILDYMQGIINGDLIKLSIGASTYFYQVDDVEGNKIHLLTTQLNDTPPSVPASVNTMEIIRSGRTNQLNSVAGTITTYGDTALIDYPLDASEMANRESFASALTVSFLTLSYDSLHLSSWPDFILSPCGGCDTGTSYIIADKTATTFELWLRSEDCEDECYNSFPFESGAVFDIDSEGNLIYRVGSSEYMVTCINFCGGLSGRGINAVAASATIYDDNWTYTNGDYPLTGLSSTLNDYERGKKGKWRPKDTYAYKDSIVGGAKSAERIYKEAGTFDMTLFNWEYPEANDTTKWLKLNTVTKYSPDGNALEEMNILGIYSAAKFGYKNTMPYMVAQNADYSSVQFESFENVYEYNSDYYLENGVAIDDEDLLNDTYAHSGKYSYTLGGEDRASFSLNLKSITLTSQLLNKGLSVKVWVKDLYYQEHPVKGKLGTIELVFNKIARTGEWVLYEAKVTSWGSYQAGNTVTPTIESTSLYPNSLWIDDVRIQPMDAQAICYVYDVNSLRLLTSFDDQHFGLYYQYNAEGKLVRKLIETERGVKTVQETQYHTPAKMSLSEGD